MSEQTSTQVQLSPFLGSFMTVIFIFSTIYSLAFYYYQGTGQTMTSTGLDDDAKSLSSSGSWVASFIDSVLELASWLSPFALLKALLIELMSGTPEIYEVLNMLILRPVGWIMALFTGNYLISKIPTMSGET